MVISKRFFYSIPVVIIGIIGSLVGLTNLIFVNNKDTDCWLMTLIFTLYLLDFRIYKTTGETSAFRRAMFLILFFFLAMYNWCST